jgi:MFS family permease
MQIIFAPIQSGLSDIYGRKKSLIVSLSFSLLSLILISLFINSKIFLSFLALATISKGVIGNTLPISLAVIADTQRKNYRVSFAFSTAAYAFAYLVLASIIDLITFDQISFYLILLFIFLIIICLKSFNVVSDKNEKDHSEKPHSIISIVENETKLIIKDLKHVPTCKALAAFFFWETSLYSILLSQIDFQINKQTRIAQSMMFGYLLGVFLLFFLKKIKDNKIIKTGYYISFFSLVPYFILFQFVESQNELLRICYFFHALGNAFLSPALLSILAKERKAHEQGRIYGLTDSVDTLGFLCATFAIMLFTSLKLELIYLISFSFLTFAISWIFYNRFRNITNERI